MPTNTQFSIPFLGGGPSISEQILQGLHEGFQEKQQKEQLGLEKQRVQTETQRSNVLNELTQAQIAHDAQVTAYEKETNPIKKHQALNDLQKSAIELGFAKHKAAYYGYDADAMEKAATPEGIEPPKPTATGTSVAPVGPTPFERQIQNAETLLGPLDKNETPIWENGKNLGKKLWDDAPISAAVNEIIKNRQAVHKAEMELTPFKSWQAKFTRENGREPTSAEIERFQTLGPAAGAAGRGEIINKDFYDSETGSLVQLNANDFNRFNKQDPGRYVEYSGTVANSLKAQSLVNGIKDISKQFRNILSDPDFKPSAELRSKLSLASRATDQHLFDTIIAGIAVDKLKPKDVDYMNVWLNMHERSMSMRTIQGQGAGSDQQREAVFRSIPGLIDSKESALKKLDIFDNEIQNLDKAIPKIGKTSKKTAGEAKAGAKKDDPLGIF